MTIQEKLLQQKHDTQCEKKKRTRSDEYEYMYSVEENQLHPAALVQYCPILHILIHLRSYTQK